MLLKQAELLLLAFPPMGIQHTAGKLCFTVYLLRILHRSHTYLSAPMLSLGKCLHYTKNYNTYNARVTYFRHSISHVSLIYLFLISALPCLHLSFYSLYQAKCVLASVCAVKSEQTHIVNERMVLA